MFIEGAARVLLSGLLITVVLAHKFRRRAVVKAKPRETGVDAQGFCIPDWLALAFPRSERNARAKAEVVSPDENFGRDAMA